MNVFAARRVSLSPGSEDLGNGRSSSPRKPRPGRGGSTPNRDRARVVALLSDWLVARDGDPLEDTPPDPSLASRIEPEAHRLLKAHWVGRGFDFGGLVAYVGPTTPDGVVEVLELVRTGR